MERTNNSSRENMPGVPLHLEKSIGHFLSIFTKSIYFIFYLSVYFEYNLSNTLLLFIYELSFKEIIWV